MRCPSCGSLDTQVKDSRPTEDSAAIRRRRVCLTCNFRFTTFERVQLRELVVIKRNGRRVPFDRDKLRSGIDRAASGRLDAATVDTMVGEIEEELRALGGEVPSDRVGVAVLEHLRVLDPVAYLRFASVYKGFEDIADFEREVGELQKTTEPKRR